MKKSRQYTIRAISPDLDKALRLQAKREGRSLNDVVLEALARGAGLNGGPRRYHDLDHLAGKWVEDPEFNAAIEAQDQIDPELWR